LDSWKSIARHFGRSCRTVQRWHSEFGLPIHRLGGNKSSIFAYPDELEEWMRNRGRTIGEEPPDVGKPVLVLDPISHTESVIRGDIFDASLIPHSGRRRSAELAALAFKMWEALSYSNLRLIVRHFREAVDLDPFHGEAFAGLSQALIAEGLLGNLRPTVAYVAAEAALHRALEIDAKKAEAICATGWLKMVSKRDWQGARRSFDEALNERPSSTRAMVGRALLHLAEGSLQDGSRLLLEAAQKNALSSLALALYGWSDYLAGQYGDALLQIEQARGCGHFGRVVDAVEGLACIQLENASDRLDRVQALAVDSPQHEVVQGILGYLYGMAGQRDKANKILDAMTRPEAIEKKQEPYAIALILIGLNERKKAVHWLEQSYLEGSLWSLGFLSDPILEPLRGDTHFQLLLNKVSYPAQGQSRLPSVG
jgi:Tfp pilus assembly protein PilF